MFAIANDKQSIRIATLEAQLAAERGKVEELKAIWTYRIGSWMSPLELIKNTAKCKKITSHEMFIEWCEDYAPKISALAEPTQPTPAPSAEPNAFVAQCKAIVNDDLSMFEKTNPRWFKCVKADLVTPAHVGQVCSTRDTFGEFYFLIRKDEWVECKSDGTPLTAAGAGTKAQTKGESNGT